MATPTYIFQAGSCQKQNLFNTIISLMAAAGWTNVSSNPTTDFFVMQSPGVNADKKLVIQLRPTNSTGANSVLTTIYSQISYRLIDSYTPGASGVAGTFGRTALAWTDMYLVPGASGVTFPVDATINYKYYVDAGKIIISLEYPPSSGLSPILIYIGQPDSSYVTESNSSGFIVATSLYAPTTSSLSIDNTVDGTGAVAAPYSLATQSLLPAKSPNNANKYMVADIYYGNTTTEGIRGKLDGIYCITNSAVLTGDTIAIGSQSFYVLVCQVQSSSSFPSQALLVRMA